MWFSSLRFACGETKVLLFPPFCHGKEKELHSPTPPSEVHVPRGENPPKTMDSPNGHSRAGFRCIGHRDVSCPQRSPASLDGGHSNAKEGQTGDRPLTVPSPLPDGRPPGVKRRSLRKREPIARPRRKERKTHFRVSVPFSHDSRFGRSQAAMRGAIDWQPSGVCRSSCSRVDLTAAVRRPSIRFPLFTMDDSNTPATKADIQEVLKQLDKVNERIDGLDKRLNRRLDDIDRQLRILVEQTHHDLGEASHDAEEVLKDHDRRLEKRVARLEEAVGLTAA